MKLTLPARSEAPTIQLNTHRLTIVGANGAGKTRFSRALADSLGPQAFMLSALRAIYDRDDDPAPRPGSIDALYHEAVGRSALIRPDLRGEFERMTSLLVHEAVVDLMAARYQHVSEDEIAAPRLDIVVKQWQELFPANEILVEYGKLLVQSTDNGDAYSAGRLSAGERAVMYYLGASLLAPRSAVVFVESPEMFLHASVVRPLWDRIERLRPDCVFVYVTHDLGFAATRADSDIIWVRSCDAAAHTWQYELLPSAEGLPDDVYLAILGERKPVLFIEGDLTNSFDAKLYPLIFPEFTVKPLGGCDRVIEATRSFNGLRSIHNLDAFGIVDRDRRDDAEVAYLRKRRVLVPEVAEIENIFLLEDVVRVMAEQGHRRADHTFSRVRRNVLSLFEGQIKRQALEHTRHRLKKEVAHRVDGKFDNIAALERHMSELMLTINPRGIYRSFVKQFEGYLHAGDYASVLRVFNYKSMVSEVRVADLCGMRSSDKRSYINAVLRLLRTDTAAAATLRTAIRATFPGVQ